MTENPEHIYHAAMMDPHTAAELDLTVGMAGTSDGVLGFSADAYNFEMELVREDDEWILISARWGEVGGEIH